MLPLTDGLPGAVEVGLDHLCSMLQEVWQSSPHPCEAPKCRTTFWDFKLHSQSVVRHFGASNPIRRTTFWACVRHFGASNSIPKCCTTQRLLYLIFIVTVCLWPQIRLSVPSRLSLSLSLSSALSVCPAIKACISVTMSWILIKLFFFFFFFYFFFLLSLLWTQIASHFASFLAVGCCIGMVTWSHPLFKFQCYLFLSVTTSIYCHQKLHIVTLIITFILLFTKSKVT